MIFCVDAALHLKSHTFSRGVMAGLHAEALTNTLHNNVFYLFNIFALFLKENKAFIELLYLITIPNPLTK